MKKKIISIGIVVVILAGIGIFISSMDNAIEVNTSAVIVDDIAEYVEELGAVKSKNHEKIYSPVSGRVNEIMVDIGDKVKKGDTLLKLDGEQLSRQIADLDAQRTTILAQYEEAKKPVDSQSIKKLELEVADIERRLKSSEESLVDMKLLYETGAVSNDEYQDAVRSLDSERSNLSKTKLDLELLKKPLSANIAAQYEAQIKQLDIQREELMDTGEDFNISAGIDGTVLEKDVEKGSFLQAGMILMEIGDVEKLYIESDILVGDIGAIKEGQDVMISSKDLGISDLVGKVTKIHPNAFSKVSDLGVEQKRIKVDIDILDAATNLKPGYDLDIKIITDSKENTLQIPENAVFTMDKKDYVFVDENGKAKLREIERGLESDRQVEVLSGLEEGENVILSPDSDLEDGVSIK